MCAPAYNNDNNVCESISPPHPPEYILWDTALLQYMFKSSY